MNEFIKDLTIGDRFYPINNGRVMKKFLNKVVDIDLHNEVALVANVKTGHLVVAALDTPILRK